ncbi:MAG: hypothetical protein K2N56_07360, partial [Oscillospiraceae bacterium]|nr:hypothetical protein [Oscillospiraceae bacterium]
NQSSRGDLPSGNYYVDGDPANDNLYLVVDGKSIHFESSGDLREAFQAIDKTMDPKYLDDQEALDHQTDITMADWGDESYIYTLMNWPGGSEKISVFFKAVVSEDGLGASGQGLSYYPSRKMINGWAGDFILAEES